MNDAYLPKMSDLVLTQDELNAIATALATPSPWDIDEQLIKDAKNKIRAHHLARHGNTCCYCRTILHGGGHFMIDREHILPKGKAKYSPYCYETWNLSVSCKRCNMQFKGQDDKFVVDKVNEASFPKAENYYIVHPNFDQWEQHLSRESLQFNQKLLVKYTLIGESEKGQYTRDYFSFKELEVNSFDEAQGIERPPIQSASESVTEARNLASSHGQ